MTNDTLAAQRPIPWRMAGWTAIGLVLLVPLIAMQFTDEVNWDLADFAAAALLLGGAGLGAELAARLSPNRAYRAGAAVALGGGLLLIWVNLAVGIVGSEDNPANLAYAVVLAVGAAAAAFARFRARGMVRAMVAMAVAQVGVAVVHLAAGHFTLLVAGVFVALWLAAAGLFRAATQTE